MYARSVKREGVAGAAKSLFCFTRKIFYSLFLISQSLKKMSAIKIPHTFFVLNMAEFFVIYSVLKIYHLLQFLQHLEHSW